MEATGTMEKQFSTAAEMVAIQQEKVKLLEMKLQLSTEKKSRVSAVNLAHLFENPQKFKEISDNENITEHSEEATGTTMKRQKREFNEDAEMLAIEQRKLKLFEKVLSREKKPRKFKEEISDNEEEATGTKKQKKEFNAAAEMVAIEESRLKLFKKKLRTGNGRIDPEYIFSSLPPYLAMGIIQL